MVDRWKRIIRKNGMLRTIMKPIYRLSRSAIRYPKEKRYGRELLKQLDHVDISADLIIWYFGVPTHPNLGDQAQKCCILRWLRENYPGSPVVEITSRAFNRSKKQILAKLKSLIRTQDLIVMQSGYTMTGIHPDEESHRVITESFPDNTVVFFPQTILFVDEKRQDKTVRALEKNQHVILLTRDSISYETARKLFHGIRLLCFPDIVTSEIGRNCFDGKREGILFCMRNDAEQFYERGDVLQLIDRLSDCGQTALTDTTMKDISMEVDSNTLWQQILSVIEGYSRYRLVITDRYHGTIFALIAGTPVIVLKTNDHKVSSGVDWFRGIFDDYVTLAEDLQDAESKARTMLSRKYTYRLDDYFNREYYQKLKRIILGEHYDHM